MPRFEVDPREVDRIVRRLDPRQELVYRLAVRGLCARCYYDDLAFRQRTDALLARFQSEFPAVLREAAALAAWIEETVAAR
jgi:hypothetical protein